MRNGFRSIAVGLFLFLIFSPKPIFAGSRLCPWPRVAPQISFSLISFGAGSLDLNCRPAVQRAIKNGFTAVTLVPARVFTGQTVAAEGTASNAEIVRCLDYAYKSGLSIIYQPHLENPWIVDTSVESEWRAHFAVSPDADYESLMFDAFFSWLDSHKSEIRKKDQQVDLVVSAELETSNTQFGFEWRALVERVRQKIYKLQLSGIVAVGYNPNWSPAGRLDDDPNRCRGLQAFVKSVDFVAPSFYGDWSHHTSAARPRGRVQVEERKSEMLERISNLEFDHCKLETLKSRRFSVGEFAVAGDFEHAERSEWSPMEKPEYLKERRAVYANLVDWAHHWRAEKTLEHLANPNWSPSINLWTWGGFDPIGLLKQRHIVADPEIGKLFRNYKAWRCN